MKLKDLSPGLYIVNGNVADFQEARDAHYRPENMLNYEWQPGYPKLEFYSMGWDCCNCADAENDEFEPAMVISVAEYNALITATKPSQIVFFSVEQS